MNWADYTNSEAEESDGERKSRSNSKRSIRAQKNVVPVKKSNFYQQPSEIIGDTCYINSWSYIWQDPRDSGDHKYFLFKYISSLRVVSRGGFKRSFNRHWC